MYLSAVIDGGTMRQVGLDFQMCNPRGHRTGLCMHKTIYN